MHVNNVLIVAVLVLQSFSEVGAVAVAVLMLRSLHEDVAVAEVGNVITGCETTWQSLFGLLDGWIVGL